MSNLFRYPLNQVEGNLTVVENRELKTAWLESGKSIFLEDQLKGRNPLDAIHLTQQLSAVNGVSHALASVLAFEDFAGISPSVSGQKVRELIQRISTIYSHIQFFYHCFIQDYLNKHHAEGLEMPNAYLTNWSTNEESRGDLPLVTGKEIAGNIPQASAVLFELQKIISMLTGKFPVIMNIIPGGVTNYKLGRDQVMKLIRGLEGIRNFIETIWSQDVKKVIQELPESQIASEFSTGLISFGSLGFGKEYSRSFYSPGVYIDGKQEPLNELKIYELLDHSFYEKSEGAEGNAEPVKVNLEKAGARTWIKSARYDTESLQTGVLPRILVTHFAGGNPEISDTIAQILEDLNLTFEYPDSIASRLLAQVFEGRYFLKGIFKFLIEFDSTSELNNIKNLELPEKGIGLGRIEGPSGAILHQMFIDKGKIENYRILSPGNWNASGMDEYDKSGIIETRLKHLSKNNRLDQKQANRLVHSYYLQTLEATQ